MGLLRIIWFVILCVLGYSWFGGWGVVLVILASIHFPSVQLIEVEKEPLLKDQHDYNYDPGYQGPPYD
jgi:hypothetical protein